MLNEKLYDTKQRTQEIASELRGKGPSAACCVRYPLMIITYSSQPTPFP